MIRSLPHGSDSSPLSTLNNSTPVFLRLCNVLSRMTTFIELRPEYAAVKAGLGMFGMSPTENLRNKMCSRLFLSPSASLHNTCLSYGETLCSHWSTMLQRFISSVLWRLCSCLHHQPVSRVVRTNGRGPGAGRALPNNDR